MVWRKNSLPFSFGSVLFVVGLILFLFIQCKRPTQQVNTSPSATQPREGLPPDFMNFYMRFHTDSIFQMNHITFPLDGYEPNIGLDSTGLQPTKWQMEEWRMHRPFDAESGNFRQEYQTLNNMVVEFIINDDERMAMERRFGKLGDEWYLIYYMGMNRVSVK